MKKQIVSISLVLCIVFSLLPIMALATSSTGLDDTLGMYRISYDSSHRKPDVSGTSQSPILEFTRGTYGAPSSNAGSGGAITSKYTMDFTRSFEIKGSVAFAFRDGISISLHNNPNKTAYNPSWNTSMIDIPLNCGNWAQTNTTFNVNGKNDMENGLLWDFMQLDVVGAIGTGDNAGQGSAGSRAHCGAYSYKIQDINTIVALNDDSGNGMKNIGTKNTDGDFLLKWERSDTAAATGKLTLTMGGTSFTYTGLDAASVFGGLANANAVYFTMSCWAPELDASDKDFGHSSKITIDSAYYTDTGDGGNSTLGVETSYYIDTDNDGVFETQLKESTLVSAENTVVLARNKITNHNKNAISSMSTAMLIPNLSYYVAAAGTKITAISDEKLYWHEHGGSEEEKPGGITKVGNGPLNSAAQYTDYATISLPAGGDGSTAYNDAYAVYEYKFVLTDKETTRLSQTIQIGVEPFTPAIITGNVYFNSPAAFDPEKSGGILFSSDGDFDGENIGLYRVVLKEKTTVTLLYDGDSALDTPRVHTDADTWLNGDYLTGYFSPLEQAAAAAYSTETAGQKLVLPSEDEVKDGGTWGFDNAKRAPTDSINNWWLRTAGDTGGTAKAVTQNGTAIVDLAESGLNGVRPAFKLNLASVLYVTNTEVGKQSGEPGPDALTALPGIDAEDSIWKLTLIDPLSVFRVAEDGTEIVTNRGDTLVFNYSGFVPGGNEYISAILSNSLGVDLYYGRLLKPDSADGTVSVTVPEDLNGSYNLKIFSETVDDTKAADIGSQFQAILINVGNVLSGTVALSGTAQYGCELTATVTDSNNRGSLTYQWMRGDEPISGATSATYTCSAEDIGELISCAVSDSGDNSRDGTISSDAQTIGKKVVTVKADDKSMVLGAELPELTVSYTGFVYADTEEDVIETVASAKTDTDGKTAGNFDIEIDTEAELSTEAGDLYTLEYETGTLTVFVPSFPEEQFFVDIDEGDWFYDDVAYVFNKKLMLGTDDTHFSPELEVTRGMIATILWRIAGEPRATSGNPFSDVAAGSYFEAAVAWAAENKIVEGYGNGKFGPEDSITREQFAAILYRYCDVKGLDASSQTDLSAFKDAENISDFALPAVKWAVAAGLLKGYDDGTLSPKGFALRCESAAILHRFCEGVAK